MALSIVADSNPAPALPGITTGSRWFCDTYTGTADALVAAHVVTREQLEPQRGRPEGRMVFLPRGEPCPPNRKAWREPGYKSITRQEDGTYAVEVTVSKEVQAWRRKAVLAAKHEQEQERINTEIAEAGHRYRNWHLQQKFGDDVETWEGTKGQLQAAGLGVGLAFPGEPGAPEYLHCKCPLGFEFRIHLPTYDRAKAAAGIYVAYSWYVERDHDRQAAEYRPFAPGVLLHIRPIWYESSNTYVGTADALVAAGLVPSLSLFPGQPGANKVRASYRKDWTPCTTANGQNWGATITRRSAVKFAVEVPLPSEERDRRKAAKAQRQAADKVEAARLRDERKKLRELASHREKTVEEFREDRARSADLWTRLIWKDIFAAKDGALEFDIPEGSPLYDELAEAFETICNAARNARVVRDRQVEAEMQKRLKLTAARNDKGLQSLLNNAQHLRLVHSTPRK